ncbi:integrase [Bacteroidia bacterium]|nr:integrase [Bacteroidia bacterium]
MKRTIKIDLSPKKKDESQSKFRAIRMRVSYGGRRVDLHIGYSVEADKWDPIEKRAVAWEKKNPYGQTAQEINQAIEESMDRIDEIFDKYKLEHKQVPTPQELKRDFNISIGRKSIVKNKNEFFDIYTNFVKIVGNRNGWSVTVYKNFSTLFNHLQTYDAKLSFQSLTEDTLQDFLFYLYKINLRNSTIAKYVAQIRWFLRWACKKGHYTGTLHDDFKPRLKGTDGNSKEVVYLEWEELMILYHFHFPSKNKKFAAIRDVFCFCCFTGLRYSDVAKLHRSDVKKDYISVVTQKTHDGLKIELNNYSRAILEKYAAVKLKRGRALPVVCIEQMNAGIKEIGKLVGINEPQRIVYFKGRQRCEEVHPKCDLLTSHCGRRTFIVNAMRLGVPATVIMSWTGHSNYQAMKPYLKVVGSLKKAEMDKFNRYMSDPCLNDYFMNGL